MKVRDAIKMLEDNDQDEHIVFDFWTYDDIRELVEDELGEELTKTKIASLMDYLDDLDEFDVDLIEARLSDWINQCEGE